MDEGHEMASIGFTNVFGYAVKKIECRQFHPGWNQIGMMRCVYKNSGKNDKKHTQLACCRKTEHAISRLGGQMSA